MQSKRITRALLVSDVSKQVKEVKKDKTKKKVKFEDAVKVNKDDSIMSVSPSDEGIDVSFSPHPILATILRPKHPLPNSWTFWYSAGSRKMSWKKNQKRITTVTTIEEFWVTYNQMKLVSDLPTGYTYSLFKTGILPDREDAANRAGGMWVARFTKEERKVIDAKWLEILDMLLGEDVGGVVSSVVTGVEACARKSGDKLEMWMGNVNRMEEVLRVGRLMKDRVKAGHDQNIQLSIHSEEKKGENGPKLML